MASTLLRDTDAVSMSRSLEVRVPFLDTPLVEFVQSLPEVARQEPGVPKALLKEAIGDALPPGILAQRKRTFTLPWEQWLRGPLRSRVEASFAEPARALVEHFYPHAWEHIWAMFLAGKTSWSRPWSLFVLNEWCRRHLAT
jgi:asparagine synthase (glutamine-hydrolysing)